MNEVKRKIRHGLLGVVYFFPFQLFFAHLKRNHLLLVFWVVLFGLVTQTIANKYGIPQLLFFPEYLENVGFLSHVILGLACGSFIMAFNMSSYIMNGFRFPFIATLSRPFLKYSINNFIIPGTFLVVYLYYLVNHQLKIEYVEPIDIALHVFGFLLGVAFFTALSMTYFISTNKSIFKILNLPKAIQSKKYRSIQNLLEPDLKWYHFLKRQSEWKIETYLTESLGIRRARSSSHYKQETLKEVFKQNHLNASLFEMGAIVSVFFLGWFMEFSVFEIPAGASIFLLLSMSLMFSGALHNWLKGWSIFGFVVIFLIGNEMSKLPEFRYKSGAYGLTYESPTNYSNEVLRHEHQNRKEIESAYLDEVRRLKLIERKNKNRRKLVLINTSGGGLRSALWTFLVLQRADSLSNGKFTDCSALITGASGGMIGSAYYRELALRQRVLFNNNTVANAFANNLSKDVLNALAFSWLVNDFFLRFRKLEYAGQFYTRDRGYYFEQKLNANTHGILDVPISYYDLPVSEGIIPEMWFSPSITNDGRKLIIGSQSSKLLYKSVLDSVSRNAVLDFRSFFKNAQADSLRFLSALRMNATFPYVLPNVWLPTNPEMEVMDAGVRDNYGTSLSYLYLNAMKNHIDSAYDDIIIVRIIDNPDEIQIQDTPFKSLTKSIATPVGTVYQNLFNTQRLAQEEYGMLLPQSIKSKITTISFNLPLENPNEIPLSWHLSAKAKDKIRKSIEEKGNKLKMEQLISILEHD